MRADDRRGGERGVVEAASSRVVVLIQQRRASSSSGSEFSLIAVERGTVDANIQLRSRPATGAKVVDARMLWSEPALAKPPPHAMIQPNDNNDMCVPHESRHIATRPGRCVLRLRLRPAGLDRMGRERAGGRRRCAGNRRHTDDGTRAPVYSRRRSGRGRFLFIKMCLAAQGVKRVWQRRHGGRRSGSRAQRHALPAPYHAAAAHSHCRQDQTDQALWEQLTKQPCSR